MNNYYIADDNAQQRGPFPIDQLAAQGVRPTTMVWSAGMAGWLPASQVPEIAGILGQAAQAFSSPQQAQPVYPQQGYAPQSGYAPQQPQYHPSAPYQQVGQVPQAGQFQPVQYAQGGYGPVPSFQEASGKKIAAGICAILIGSLGIHKFILGFNTAGIIYLTKSDQDFYQQYMIEKKQWF